MKISYAYFNGEVVKFRSMFGDKRFMSSPDDLEMLDKAFSALFLVYIHATVTDVHEDTTEKQKDNMETTILSTREEWGTRKLYALNSMMRMAS